MAFYLIEPWGQPWLALGRATSMIRAALVGKWDKHEEERFLITYRQGDEYRPKVALSDDEISERLASLPGLKRKKKCLSLARSRRSSPPTRRGS